MKTKTTLLPIIILAILTSASCAPKHLKNDFGDANKKNIKLQTRNTEAARVPSEHTLDGSKGEQIIRNYRKERPTVTRESLVNISN